jgi:Putative Flp pilus-assembly TadE/G-like
MLSAARGQSIPFWTFATIGVLAMMLFVLNYALNVSWTIRAQNAADSASAATHSAVANVYNEESTLLYAASVDEFRLRALNQAILNTINHNGGCSATIGGTCEQNYNQLVQAYTQVEKNYADLVHLLGQANQLTQAGQNTAAQKIFSLLNPCGGSSTLLDTAFCYTYVGYSNAQGHGSKATPSVVQVVACRNVPWIGGGLFGLGAKFTAVASGASAIASAQVEHFVPSAVNAATSQPYQSNESSWFGYSLPDPTPPYEVVFNTPGSPLAVDINWYTVVPYSNAAAVAAGSYACAS